MPVQKQVGVMGLGNMGRVVAEKLHAAGYKLVLYNRTSDRYEPFKGKDGIYLSDDINDFSKELARHRDASVIWMMLPGGAVTNEAVSNLSSLLRKGDIVIDASNAIYTDSIANYKKLRSRSISYLDVGCAGGPEDLLNGVALMAGGDKRSYDEVTGILKTVAGTGTYGYVGKTGSGQITKLVHNGIFYGIFPVYAEGVELLLKLKDESGGDFNIKEALRLLASSPPINNDIMAAISRVMEKGLPPDAPEMKVSEVIKWEAEKANKVGVDFGITKSVLSGYTSMSEVSRRIYAAAKKLVTGH